MILAPREAGYKAGFPARFRTLPLKDSGDMMLTFKIFFIFFIFSLLSASFFVIFNREIAVFGPN